MRYRYLTSLGVLAVGLTVVCVATVSVRGQTPAPKPVAAPAPKFGPAPRTPWGEPDLQGTWFVMESVPLERSTANVGKPLLSDAEVAALDKGKAGDMGRNMRSENATRDVEGAYNAVFNSVLKTSKRTSMIIDPPDGKIPPQTPEAQQRQGRGGGGRGGAGGGRGGATAQNDNPRTTAQ